MNYLTLKTACGKSILVDRDDYDYLSNFNWFILKGRNTNYARTNYQGKTKVLTHVIADFLGWNIENKVVDHKNGNGMDNRKSNLQVISQRQNVSKDAGWKNSSSEFRNVRRHRDKWLCEVYIKGITYYLGVYNEPEEAYLVSLFFRQEVGY